MLDASAAAAWLVPGQATLASDALLAEAHQHRFEAPHIFPAEVRSLLLKLERRGRFDAVFTTRALESLVVYDIDVDVAPEAMVYDSILEVARRERLSVYDALYLWHAMQRGVALASRDGSLLSAAAAQGVTVLNLLEAPSW